MNHNSRTLGVQLCADLVLTDSHPCRVTLQIPTIGFLYFAGWIGYAGTKYVQEVKKGAKPIEKEIIIDVPLAWRLLWAGLGWPVAAVAELRTGTLLEDDSNITVSPR